MAKTSDAIANEEFLTRVLAITDPVHQKYLIEQIPCGMESVEEAWNDKTDSVVNLPRAMMVVFWKGQVRALQQVERLKREALERSLQDVCPKCHKHTCNDDAAQTEEGMRLIDGLDYCCTWVCECGCEFKDYYRLVYDSKTVYDEEERAFVDVPEEAP